MIKQIGEKSAIVMARVSHEMKMGFGTEGGEEEMQFRNATVGEVVRFGKSVNVRAEKGQLKRNLKIVRWSDAGDGGVVKGDRERG